MAPETRLGLAVGLGGLTAVLDTTVAVLALPVLTRDLGAPLSSVQWVTTAYVLTLVAVIPLAAAVGARIGVRRAYLAALAVFALGSLLAAVAPSLGALIAARVVQGLGGGLVTPLGTTLALRGVPARRRGRVTSLLGLPLLVGPLLGPLVAGSLLDGLGWRAIFLITVPPALVTIALVRRLAPTDPTLPADRAARPPVDLIGAVLLVPGVVATVWAIGEATAPVWVRATVAVLGLLLAGAFAHRAWRHPAPLVRVRLLAQRRFAVPATVLALFAAPYFGSMLLSPTYIQTVRGDRAVVAGAVAMAAGFATGISAQVATRLVDRLPARTVVTAGLILAVASTATGAVVLRPETPYWVLVMLAVGLGAGSGAVLLPTIATATRELDGDALASGSTILTLISQLATAIGTAAVTSGFSAAVDWLAPGLTAGVGGLPQLSDAARADVVGGVVDAQRLTMVGVALPVVVALVLASRLPGRDPRKADADERRCPEGVSV